MSRFVVSKRQVIISSLVIFALYGFAISNAQEVSSRLAQADDGRIEPELALGAGSSSRASGYNHKQLSPHRMMHFGKRPLVVPAPRLLNKRQAFDIFQEQRQFAPQFNQQHLSALNSEQNGEQQQQQQQDLAAATFPYTLYFPIQRSQVLELMPDAFAQDKHFMNSIINLVELAKQRELEQRKRNEKFSHEVLVNPPAAIKLMRLVASGNNANAEPQQAAQQYNYVESNSAAAAAPEADKTNNANLSEQQQQQGTNELIGQQQQQQLDAQQGENINLSTRSVASVRNNNAASTRPFNSLASLNRWSSFLGRPTNSGDQLQGAQISLANFIKKAEPQRMTFMHFGR